MLSAVARSQHVARTDTGPSNSFAELPRREASYYLAAFDVLSASRRLSVNGKTRADITYLSQLVPTLDPRRVEVTAS